MKIFLSEKAAKKFTTKIMGGEPNYLCTDTNLKSVFELNGNILSCGKGGVYTITKRNGERIEFRIQSLEVPKSEKELIMTLLYNQMYVCNDVSSPLVHRTIFSMKKIFEVLDTKVFESYTDI